MDSDNQPNSRLDAIVTRWTLLNEAHAVENASSVEARQTLVLRYLPAIRRYVGAITQQDDLAQDMTQEVVVRLMSGGFSGADPHRGRFRDLLKTAIRNLIRNHWAREQRRRTTSLEVDDLADNDRAADEAWDESWRNSVLDLAWNALKQQEVKHPDTVPYTLLRLRAEHPDESSEELAQRLSKHVGRAVRPDAFRQKLRRARLQFVDLLIAEIGRGLVDPTPERIEEELIALELHEYVRDLLPSDS